MPKSVIYLNALHTLIMSLPNIYCYSCLSTEKGGARRTKRCISLVFLCCLLIGTQLPAQVRDLIDTPLQTWKFSEAGKNEWKNAEVPGNIHSDLLANNLLPDPTLRDNEKKCQWVEKKNWEYTTSLFCDSMTHASYAASCAELVFESLDTYADVFLNDSLVLITNNMFRSYSVRVEKLLKTGTNHLRILFHTDASSIVLQNQKPFFRFPADNDSTSPYTRKSALQYGWDFAPRMVTCGIRKRVHLKVWKDFVIRDVHMIQKELTPSKATLIAETTIESVISDSVTLVIEPTAFSKRVYLCKGINHVQISFHLDDPELWWPNGMGEPHMYEARVVAYGRRFRSSYRVAYGLRTLDIISKKDSLGKSFYLRLNGIPLYVKGANLVPPPLLLKKEFSVADLLTPVVEGGMNMVRIWGGGLYGDDDFYLAADQSGILIWQDFMFTGTMYPGDTAFLRNVEQEAEQNIIRIRNHPSLALWCGNNEIEVAWNDWGWKKQFHYNRADSIRMMHDYDALFRALLPGKVMSLDSGRFYFSSTPMSNWSKTDDLKKGDNHYWGVWHGEQPFDAYNTHVARFMSEFGFQSFPEKESLRKFSNESDWNAQSDILKAHQFSHRGSELIDKYLSLYYRAPKDFESFVYLSQLLQGDAMKTAIEAQRRSKPFCMGSLFWQLNDYWPSASWSVVDYYGSEKAAFFKLKKAYRPFLVSPIVEKEVLTIYAVSDETKTRKAELYVLVSDLKGEHKKEIRQALEVKANSSTKLFSRSLKKEGVAVNTTGLFDDLIQDNCFIYTALIRGKDTLADNICYLVPPKDLQLEPPVISIQVKKEDDHYLLKLKSNVLAKDVYLSSPITIFPEDNFFDLLPGKEKTILFYSDQTAEKLKESLRLVSLWDSY
jgi:beta-mannosidase